MRGSKGKNVPVTSDADFLCLAPGESSFATGAALVVDGGAG
jgi:hypothetical protein